MKAKLLVLLVCACAFLTEHAVAQQRIVSGKVTAALSGEELPGVNIRIKGTTLGVVTDIAGSYKILVPEESDTLIFSYVGFNTEQVQIGNQSVIDMILMEDLQSLQEIVVTAIGIEQNRRALGYAVQALEGNVITKVDNPTGGFLNSLQGKVAGVQIVSSSPGDPGASTRVVMRGISSLTGDNQPLYVVDGIPIDNSSFTSTSVTGGIAGGNRANDLNPENIASLTFLKGTAAAALYGTRASNGAVIITTKSGKNTANVGKKAEISYSGTYTALTPLRLPSFQNTYGGGEDFEANIGSQYSWGPRVPASGSGWIVRDAFGDSVEYKIYPNNLKDFYQTGFATDHNISFAGGTENTDYRFSVGYFTTDGVVPNTGFEKTSISLNAGHKFTNKFFSRITLNLINSGASNRLGSGAGSGNAETFHFLNRSINLSAYKDYKTPNEEQRGKFPFNYDNPYWTLYQNTYSDDVRRVFGGFTLGYEATDWLKFTSRFGGDIYADERFQKYAEGSRNNSTGGLFKDQYNVQDLNVDALAEAKKKVGDDIKMTLMLGANLRSRSVERLYASGNGLVLPNVYSFTNAQSTYVFSNESKKRLSGVFGQYDISYKNYAFLSVTARNDWSSTLPESNNSFFYPGVSASVNFTDVLGMESKILTFGKIRGNWAQAGRDADPYRINDYYMQNNIRGFHWTGIYFPFKDVQGYSVSDDLGNLNLLPELTTTWEIGTDLQFFGDRIIFDGTYYESLSDKQIFLVAVPSSTGYSRYLTNAGELRNRGVELLVDAEPIRTQSGFSWRVSANFTKNHNTVVSMPEGIDQIRIGGGFISPDIVARIGEPYGAIVGTAYKRDANGKLLLDGEGRIQVANERKVLGNIQPDFQLGLGTTVAYKGVSLYALLHHVSGGDIVSFTVPALRTGGHAIETLEGREEAYYVHEGTIEEGGSVNDIKLYSRDYWNDIHSADEGKVFDATYWKLREVRLAYDLPAKLLKKTPFGKVEFAAIGSNLFLWGTNIPHIDPEVNLNGSSSNRGGQEYGAIPSVRSFGGSMKFTF